MPGDEKDNALERTEKELAAAQLNFDGISRRLREIGDDMIQVEREFGSAYARLERATEAHMRAMEKANARG